jgi:hypothetical protein
MNARRTDYRDILTNNFEKNVKIKKAPEFGLVFG